jgi:hypothetical protein
MNEFSQSGTTKPISAAGPLDCAAVERWLAEVAEGGLGGALNAHIEEHATGCADCQEKLLLARRGREWLLVLKHENLDPPADLVAKILARTFGAEISPAPRTIAGTEPSERLFGHGGSTTGWPTDPREATGGYALPYQPEEYAGDTAAKPEIPEWQRTSLVALRHKIMEPRLALVAAMAFFSISLTLNLVGIHITKVRAADLQPQNLRRAVTRHYAEANAHVVRYYENLRIVYELEARVQQLRRAAEAPPVPQESPAKPRNGSSDSSRDPGRGESSQPAGITGTVQKPAEKNAVPADPAPLITGPRLDVAFPASHLMDMLGNRSGVTLTPSMRWKVNSAKDFASFGQPKGALPAQDLNSLITDSDLGDITRSTSKERGLA